MDSFKKPPSSCQVGGMYGRFAQAHSTVESSHLPPLIVKAKQPKKCRDCQEKGRQYKRSIFLLDEPLQLRYNLPAAGWLLIFSRPVPR
jgi:hypothetical protein